jgi:predicted  nucleic acid-binding Zn-ribbon protein
MSENPFVAFVDLVKCDESVLNSKKQLSTTQHELEKIVQKQKIVEQQQEERKSTLYIQRKEVDRSERLLKETEHAIASKKRRLHEISSPKEYSAVQQELDMLEQNKNELDEKLLSLWQAYEEQSLRYQEEDGLIMQQLQHYHTQSASYEKRIIELEAEIEQKQTESTYKKRIVPADWLEKYKIMGSRIENPVISVTQGSCSACFYPISQQDLAALQRHRLVECKGCFRLLYCI